MLAGVCLEKLVERWPQALFPYPDNFDALVWHWALFTQLDQFADGVPWPPRQGSRPERFA